VYGGRECRRVVEDDGFVIGMNGVLAIVIEDGDDFVRIKQEVDGCKKMLFVFWDTKEIVGKGMGSNRLLGMVRESGWCCEHPAIAAGCFDGDGDAIVVGRLGASTSVDEARIEKLVLDVVIVFVTVEKLVAIVEVRVPSASELTAGLLPVAEFAEELAVRVCNHAKQ
jgi:hypothetical protein